MIKLEKGNFKSLYNYRTKDKICIIVANSYSTRLLGLMFKKEAKNPLLLEIPQKTNNRWFNRKRSAIHSFFMCFEIAIVFVGTDLEVFEIANLKPWRYYTPQKGAKYIIEFDKNDFLNYNIKIGDKLEIK